MNHVLSANEMTQLTGKCIVDSGATSHICNDQDLSVKLDPLKILISVMLGDGCVLKATAQGIVSLKMTYDCGTRKCKLHDLLHVPHLSYNLLSVSKAVEKGVSVMFDESRYVIHDTNQTIITVPAKAGGLYHTNTAPVEVHSMMAHYSSFSREDLLHRRYGHLSVKSLKKLARDDLVKDFDYSASKGIQFCESCLEGKQCRSPFPSHLESCSKEVLDLVHSDVCVKINAKSLGGAGYFLTLFDDKTRYHGYMFSNTKMKFLTSFVNGR